MKHKNSLQMCGAAGWVLWVSLTFGEAATTNATLVARARAANIAAPAPSPVTEQAVPKSAFVIPQKADEGKDPFFPNSTRVYTAGIIAKPVAASNVVADLTLKGISGSTEQPLAIINTTTFSAGEANDVILKNGRIKVQCLEINMSAGTVLVQIGGERRELRLQSLK